MNRALLLVLTLGIGALTGCAMQTANGEPSANGEENTGAEQTGSGTGTPAAATDSDPLSEGTTAAETPGQQHVAEYHAGARPPAGVLDPLVAVRGAGCASCSGDLDNSQPLPWNLKVTTTPAAAAR